MSGSAPKQIPDKLYACCPICSATLLRAESAKKLTIKCESCKQFIAVEIDGGDVRTHIQRKEPPSED